MNVLITGIAGFLGSHLTEHILRKTDFNIVGIDKLSYASKGLSRLKDNQTIDNHRVRVFTYDLNCPISDGLKSEIGHVDIIIHLCAETHVDNSIANPIFTIQNNINSTLHMLEYARELKIEKFFYFSTDEVYGNALGDKSYNEDDLHTPTNPYSASKSASESICLAYKNTYNVPIIILNSMNIFGERQHVEKFIPKCIKYILENKVIDIHSYEDCKKAGSRSYIHARNVSDAILFLIEKGIVGERYHITGEKEIDNLEMAQFIANVMERDLKYNLVNFHKDRPGHDLRYMLCGDKLKNMGFHIPVNFEESLKHTILWTLKHKKWLEE